MNISKTTKVILLFLDIIAVSYIAFYVYRPIEDDKYLYLLIFSAIGIFLITPFLCLASKKIRKVARIILEVLLNT